MDDDKTNGLQALIKIDEHMRTCDRRYEEWQKRQEHTLNYLQDIHDKLNNMSDDMAERRGGEKIVRALGGAIVAGGSLIGGVIGSIGHHLFIK